VISEEATRSQLFGDDGKPRQRTADEIKAAYGHVPKALVSLTSFLLLESGSETFQFPYH